MPPPNFKSITVPSQLLDRLNKVRADIARDGYRAIPEALRASDIENGVTVGTVLESALNALEAAMAKGAKR